MHLKKEKTEFLAPVFGRQSAARRPAPALPAPQQPPADVPGFDYTAAVAEIYAHFPEAQETLRFYDLSNGRFVDPDPAEVAKMEAYMADAENARDVARFTSYAQLYAKEGNSAVMHGLDRGRCVMLSVGGNKVDLLDPGCTAAQNIYFILDHETGHAVARFGARGQFSRTLHECVADAYAVLRHYQRFGTGSKGPEGLLLRRAQRLVSLGGPRHAEHFTSVAVEQAIAVKDRVDIARLTPRQTAALATRIAIAHTPNDQAVINVARAFEPFQKMLAAQQDTDMAMRRLARIVLGTRDWEVFRWGAPVLRGYMDGTLGDMMNGSALVRVEKRDYSGKFWDGARRLLARREFRFAQEDMLYGLDLPKKPAAAQNDNCRKFNPAPTA